MADGKKIGIKFADGRDMPRGTFRIRGERRGLGWDGDGVDPVEGIGVWNVVEAKTQDLEDTAAVSFIVPCNPAVGDKIHIMRNRVAEMFALTESGKDIIAIYARSIAESMGGLSDVKVDVFKSDDLPHEIVEI